MPGLHNARHIFGDEILMFHAGHRMLNTHHRTDLIDPVAAGIDHNLSAYIALVGLHRPAVIGMLRQTRYRGETIDLSASGAGSARQGLAQLCRVDMPIGWIPEATH